MYPPSSPVGHGFAQHVTPAQLAMVLDHTVPAPNNPYPSPISAAPDWYHNGNDFEVHHSDDAGPSHRRSNSSASHQTSTTNATSRSVPASDYSYSATDMSEGEDAEMEQAEVADGLGELSIGRAGLRGEKTWTQDDQNAVQKGGKVGPIRRSSGGAAKKADKEVDRLERELMTGFVALWMLTDIQTVDRSTGSPLRNTVNAARTSSKFSLRWSRSETPRSPTWKRNWRWRKPKRGN